MYTVVVTEPLGITKPYEVDTFWVDDNVLILERDNINIAVFAPGFWANIKVTKQDGVDV